MALAVVGVDAESEGAGEDAATGGRLRFLEGCAVGGTEGLALRRMFSGGGEDMVALSEKKG